MTSPPGSTPNRSAPRGSYTAPTGDNPCMHYTDEKLPLAGLTNGCGSNTLGDCKLVGGVLTNTGCPQPDLLSNASPDPAIPQEYNFSPNIASSTAGRV